VATYEKVASCPGMTWVALTETDVRTGVSVSAALAMLVGTRMADVARTAATRILRAQAMRDRDSVIPTTFSSLQLVA
jgi:hypothetical protein